MTKCAKGAKAKNVRLELTSAGHARTITHLRERTAQVQCTRVSMPRQCLEGRRFKAGPLKHRNAHQLLKTIIQVSLPYSVAL